MVVLPAPFGPSSVTSRPVGTARVTSCRMALPPMRWVRPAIASASGDDDEGLFGRCARSAMSTNGHAPRQFADGKRFEDLACRHVDDRDVVGLAVRGQQHFCI